MLWVFCLGAAFIGLYFLKEWISVIRYDKYLQNVPGPKPLPILGNLLELGGTDRK